MKRLFYFIVCLLLTFAFGGIHLYLMSELQEFNPRSVEQKNLQISTAFTLFMTLLAMFGAMYNANKMVSSIQNLSDEL